MTSAINYLSINENFPVAGQDNDTQVFRDNFDTIKESLRVAGVEVTDLQNNTGGIVVTDLLDGELSIGSDFGLRKIANAVLSNPRLQTNDGRGESPILLGPLTIDAKSGGYQIYTMGATLSVDFLNFAGDPRNVPTEATSTSLSKVTVEFYSDLTASDEYTITFSLSGSGATQFKKNGAGMTTVGNDFTITLTSASATDPIIIEFWRHDLDTIYVRYLGEFA
jgi:hypothetical protein